MTDKKGITRRDFLDGVAISVTALAALQASPVQALMGNAAKAGSAKVYPPRLTGMRGNHPGSFDYAHPLAWHGKAPKESLDTGEEYDLVVVGGGLSGLAAATLFQRERGSDQRILILDNHDDFGGHAKRNEFMSADHMLLGIGGSVNLEDPSTYSDESVTLLEEVGLDFDKLEKAMDGDPLATLGDTSGLFLKTAKGEGKITVGRWRRALHGYDDYKGLINQLPLPQTEKDKIIKLSGGDWDYLVGLSISERIEYLESTPYHQFLLEKVGLSAKSLSLFDSWIRVLWGVGGDGISVHEALLTGAPGLGSVGWPWEIAESYLFGSDEPFTTLLLPDGNATLARLMVRKLIPAIAPGSSMDDIAAAVFDYSKLDMKNSPVRLRLNSTAINAQQNGAEVTVTYVQDGKPRQVKAKHSILACYNSIIPHLCPELPDKQKEGLKYGSKIPLVWANVVIKNGSMFEKAGANLFEVPGAFFSIVTQAPTTNLGDYQAPRKPSDPRTVFMMGSPVPIKESGQTARDQFRLARHKLLQTPFSTFEQEIKTQLTDLFGAHGFDADRDIEAITVNRWAHGYAYEYYNLDDGPFEDGAYPHEIGRRQFGRISIANSDAGASAYLNAAIDQAWRAVQEQLFIVNK